MGGGVVIGSDAFFALVCVIGVVGWLPEGAGAAFGDLEAFLEEGMVASDG